MVSVDWFSSCPSSLSPTHTLSHPLAHPHTPLPCHTSRYKAIVLFFWPVMLFPNAPDYVRLCCCYIPIILQLCSWYSPLEIQSIASVCGRCINLQSEGCGDFSWSSIESTDHAELEPELELATPLESRLLPLAASLLEAIQWHVAELEPQLCLYFLRLFPHYANSWTYLFCQKLCRHNSLIPTHILSHTHTHTLTNMPLTQGRCVGDGDALGEKNPTLPVAWESNEVMFWRPPSQTSMWQHISTHPSTCRTWLDIPYPSCVIFWVVFTLQLYMYMH